MKSRVRQHWVLLVLWLNNGALEVPIAAEIFRDAEPCWRASAHLPISDPHLARCFTIEEASARYPEIHWP